MEKVKVNWRTDCSDSADGDIIEVTLSDEQVDRLWWKRTIELQSTNTGAARLAMLGLKITLEELTDRWVNLGMFTSQNREVKGAESMLADAIDLLREACQVQLEEP